MRRRITLLLATVVVASMVVAAPAQAAAGKCNKFTAAPGFDQEDHCCKKNVEKRAHEKKCIART